MTSANSAAILAAADVTSAPNMALLWDEVASYTDANGIFTITGNVKNTHAWTAKPEIVLHIQDGNIVHSVQVPYGAIPPGGELPFKIKIPEASYMARLTDHEVSAVQAPAHGRGQWQQVTLDVMYDNTLVLHPDGSLTGVAVNSGSQALHDPVLWAVVHGPGGSVLDVARSGPLGVVESGQLVEFSMRPDPSIREPIAYYSCFAPSDVSIHPLTAHRGDQEYRMRYDSGAWLYSPVFGADGTHVTLQTTNSFSFVTYANIEIPAVTRAESFVVLRNGEAINHTQSIDETGTWHVAFDIRGHSQDIITIRGFEHGEVLPVLIPGYIHNEMYAWALGSVAEAADKTPGNNKNSNGSSGAEGADITYVLEWLSDHELLPALPTYPEGAHVPSWMATLVIWWHDARIGDAEALGAIAYMVETGIIYGEQYPK